MNTTTSFGKFFSYSYYSTLQSLQITQDFSYESHLTSSS